MKCYNCANGKRHLLRNKDNTIFRGKQYKAKTCPLKHRFHTTTHILKENRSEFIEA